MARYADDLALAHMLADTADSISSARFRAQDLHVTEKPDLTPVTDADTAVEKALRATLSRARPRDAVLRTFIVDGRVPQLPSAWAKRRIVLEHIAAVFEPGVKYPEKEVNAILRAWNDDHAALRRYLVDETLLERGDGLYWRAGGYVDVV